MKNFLLISLAALIGLMTYGTSFGAGSSDNDDSSSTEMVDVDYLNGKEEAYNGNYRAAIVYLKKSIENNPESADSFNLLGYSNRKLGNNDEAFTYYNKALEIVKSEGKASTSFLQRKLQIGYNRAARIIDIMESRGIVSKANHVGKRELL